MEYPILEKYIYVKTSVIHGSGIFTSVDIPSGTPLIRITGEIISGEECERREEEENNVYIFWNGDDRFIDTSLTEKIKFINHNCNYNCDVEGFEDELILVASRDISSGEELTIDYGYEEIYEGCTCFDCFNKNLNQTG